MKTQIIFVWLCAFVSTYAYTQRVYVTKQEETLKLNEKSNLAYKINNLSYELGNEPIHSGSRLTLDGKKLYFFTDTFPDEHAQHIFYNKGQNQDIYLTYEGISSPWTQTFEEAEINNKSHNGVHFVSEDQKRLLLLGEYYPNDVSNSGLSISTFNRLKGQWGFPVTQKVKKMEKSESISSYTMNYTEDVLLLAIEAIDAFGQQDIYVSFKKGKNKWSKPLNLGSVINTVGSEGTMTLSHDGKTLYFSSNGRADTLGGYDIYRSERLDDTWLNWSTPVNLGKPYNSVHDDLYYTFDKKQEKVLLSRKYAASNGKKYSDIISIERIVEPKKPCANLLVDLYAYPEHEHIDAQVSIVYDEHTLFKFQNTLAPTTHKLMENEKYTIRIESDEYLSYEEEITASCAEPVQIAEIELKPKKEHISWEIENVFFAFDSDILLESSFPALEEVKNILIKESEIVVEISGHTDSRGDDRYNQLLSQKRADAVVNYLIDHGISPERLVGIGYGESRLKNECSNGVACSDERHQENRRVEFEIIGIQDYSYIE